MSSHREAPQISKDPVADSTDVYAFVSPENDGTVTIIANYVPLQDPAGGPNFYEFGDDVQYDINIDNTGSGKPAITYRFNFTTTIVNPNTFLYATGRIGSLTDANFNRPQTYTVHKVVGNTSTQLSPTGGATLRCPPCNIGPRSIIDYPSLSAAATYRLSSGEMVFAGQRAEGFFVDLGSVFDLADLRPLSSNHLVPGVSMANAINAPGDKNVHSIAIRVPISSLTSNGVLPTSVNDPHAVIGVYTTASRPTVKMINPGAGTNTLSGAYTQVSRLGSPLVNEVVVPMSLKDFFNAQPPVNDGPNGFGPAVQHPELQGLLVKLYPGAFTNLAAYTKPRADLVAIFLTGIPGSVIGPAFGVGTYQGGAVPAEMLRLNMKVPAVSPGQNGYSNLGLVGGDLSGFPNGRRLTDDVVNIELKAVAGATIPLVDPSFTPDAVVSSVSQGVTANPQAYQAAFPYLADPYPGFSNPIATPASNHNTAT